MLKIGFAGLGQMGKHMAMNMAKCGQELIVNDISDKTFAEFNAQGISTTLEKKEIAKCDIIFLCLPNTEVVENYLFGEDGIAKQLKAGQIVADFSTIDYTVSVNIYNRLTAQQVKFMDAPVSGMEARAIDGTLTVMCGGEQALYDELMPYFKCVGTNILLMGSYGAGQLSKAINNTLFNINIAAFAEMLPLAVKLGLDPEQITSVINSSSGRSYASEFFLSRILKRNFADGYPLGHAYKDLVCTAEISAKQCIPLPVMHAALTTYQMALLKGHEKKDKGAMALVFEELLGVECVTPK